MTDDFKISSGAVLTLSAVKSSSILFFNLATLHLNTQTIEYHKDYTPDAVARVLWECLCHPPYEVIKSLYAEEIEQDFNRMTAKAKLAV